MSSSDLVADEAKQQGAVACQENASSSPPVALRRDLSATPAPGITMRRSWSADSLASTGVKTCVCAPTTHAGSFRCRLHRHSAVHQAHAHANTAPLPPPPVPHAHANTAPLPPPPVPSRPPPASPRSIEAL